MSQENPATRALLSADTSADAQRVQIELWRRMSPLRKARAVGELSRSVRDLSMAGIRMRHPGASERECRLRLAVLTLGRSVACRVYPDASALSTR
jgi:hypothetical protein